MGINIHDYLNGAATGYKPAQGYDYHEDVYDLRKEKPEYVHEEKNWVPLRQIQGMKVPFSTTFGYHFKEVFEERILGYVPIASFVSGGYEIKHGLKLIFDRAIQNNNTIRVESHAEDVNGRKYKNTVIYLAHLNFTQRVACVALGVALIFRGLIDFCQIGIVFLPFDRFFDWWRPLAGEPTRHKTLPPPKTFLGIRYA